MSKPWDSAGLTLMWDRGGWEGTKSAAEVPCMDVWTDGLLALPWCECAKIELFRALAVVQSADTEINLFGIFVSLTNTKENEAYFWLYPIFIFFSASHCCFHFQCRGQLWHNPARNNIGDYSVIVSLCIFIAELFQFQLWCFAHLTSSLHFIA